MVKLSENALKVAESRYFLDDDEGWEKCSLRTAEESARNEKEFQLYRDKFHEIIYDLLFLPGGRVLRNAGRARGSMFQCFQVPIGDSIEEIGQCKKDSLILWSDGGGVGITFSPLRPKDSEIKGIGGKSSGLVSFMKTIDYDASVIETGGGRRAAALGACHIKHPEVLDFIDAKLVEGELSQFNISVIIDSKFMEAVIDNKDWEFKFAQQISKTMKARVIWDKILDNMIKKAEPGLLNWDNVQKNNSYYFAPIRGSNPCFSADTFIPTKEGLIPIYKLAELPDTNSCKELTSVWDGKRWKSHNRFRITDRNKLLLKIILYDGSELKVTPQHRVILEDGTNKMAMDLIIGDKLEVSNIEEKHGFAKDGGAYLKGFLTGDGQASGEDRPYLRIFDTKYQCIDRLLKSLDELSIRNKYQSSILNIECSKEYEYDNVFYKTIKGMTCRSSKTDDMDNLYNWCTKYKKDISDRVFLWDKKTKLDYIAGIMDSDGTAFDTKNGFAYQITSIYKKWLLKFQILLKTIGVYSHLSLSRNAYSGLIKEKKVFCKKSYRLTISQYNSIKLASQVNFNRLISFKDKIIKYNVKPKFNRVVSISEYGPVDKVYCCTVNSTHKLAIGIGINIGQCGEALMEPYGSCVLGSLVVSNFISGQSSTNWVRLESVIRTAIRFLDNLIDVNKYSIENIRKAAFNGRRIGLGIMGLSEYLFAKKIRYGSEKSIVEIERLMSFIRNIAYDESINLAVEKGAFPAFDSTAYCKASFVRKLPTKLRMKIREKGIRNVTLLALAPTGSISLLPEVSSGIEPLFSKAYLRKDRISNRVYIHKLYPELLKEESLPDWYVDAYDLSPEDHFEVQVACQKYTDGGVSKTINLPTKTTKGNLDKLLREYIWDLKGITVYRDGSREDQPLNQLSLLEVKKYLSENSEVVSVQDSQDLQCATGGCEI